MFGFGKKKEQPAAHTSAPRVPSRVSPSVISADMFVLGNIASDGFVDLEGKIDGNVRCREAVIRADGIINGDIVAESVRIYGSIKGLVKAKSVTLYSSAKIEGVIMHESLSVEDGATVDGKFKRLDKMAMDEFADKGPTFADQVLEESAEGYDLIPDMSDDDLAEGAIHLIETKA